MDHQTLGPWDNQPSNPAYYIEDSQIFEPDGGQLYDETKKDGRDKKIW